MKLFFRLLLLLSLALNILPAQEYIKAMKVPGNVSKIGPQSRAWLSAEFAELTLYAHEVIKKVEPYTFNANQNNTKTIRIKALYDGDNISFLLVWEDDTKNTSQSCCPREYEDGFAIQFAQDFSDASKLPYISMGSKDRKVLIHLHKAKEFAEVQNNDAYFSLFHKPLKSYDEWKLGRLFLAEGLDNLQELKSQKKASKMLMDYKDGVWKASLSMPMQNDYLNLDTGVFPISFVLWDGSSKNTKGLDHISPWLAVKLVGKRGSQELLDALSQEVKGDISNGKRLALQNCTACHNFAESNAALANMAPNLSSIGGYASAAYLMESLMSPSAVIVPDEKKASLDFPWFRVDENANQISTMPPYDWMDEASRQDIVAYFMSLR